MFFSCGPEGEKSYTAVKTVKFSACLSKRNEYYRLFVYFNLRS